VKEVLAQQITELEDVKGNLVRTWINEFTFLVFDDGRWAYLTWYAWPEGGGGTALESDRPDIYDLWMAELLTNQEYTEQLDHGREYRAKQQELSDKKQLQRLQAKYGK
jgi:hypothetical protein